MGLRTEIIDRIVWDVQRLLRPQPDRALRREGAAGGAARSEDALVAQPDGALRVAPASVPEEIATALGDESLRRLGPVHLEDRGRFFLGERPYVVSYRALPESHGWRVGAVVAEDELLGVAEQGNLRRRLLAFVGVLSAAILVGGVLTLLTMRRDLRRITRSAGRMRDFDFSPAAPRAFFRDVENVMGGLELAKTAMRAMSKYVPVDLVRLLYRTGREPQLGGESMPVTLLFAHQGFTARRARQPQRAGPGPGPIPGS